MSLDVRHLNPGSDLSEAHFVRAEVFQKEQGISAEDDFDVLDSNAEQIVAYDDGKPVGTARYRVLEDGKTAKVERVAVLSDQRGKKIGDAIMSKLEHDAKQQGVTSLVLDAQQDAAGFYSRRGYTQVGETFEEVGIPHVKMSLDLKDI